ncbi:DUF4810 domain-containing protein [Sesbania bispinosa]|nr:DUF4810 domain-containing protein [Sesbania bispinosa]
MPNSLVLSINPIGKYDLGSGLFTSATTFQIGFDSTNISWGNYPRESLLYAAPQEATPLTHLFQRPTTTAEFRLQTTFPPTTTYYK